MATIHGNAALTILKIAFVQKFIYLFTVPLLVSDTECDGQSDLPILRILCVCVCMH